MNKSEIFYTFSQKSVEIWIFFRRVMIQGVIAHGVFDGSLPRPFRRESTKNYLLQVFSYPSYLSPYFEFWSFWLFNPSVDAWGKHFSEISLEKPLQEKSCQIACCIIKLKNKKHVLMKDLDSEKIEKKKTDCCYQVFYLWQVFSI